MTRTNLSVQEMLADPDHAAGYRRRDGVMVPVPQRPVVAMSPAGAINSSAADMTRWMLAQLGGGQLDGTAVMSPATARRQHTPHIVSPGDGQLPGLTQYAYGLGWAIGRYRDHQLAMHGGGIDGFQALLMLRPDDGIGVTVLTNVSGSAMRLVVACRVLDELLGAEPLDVFGFVKPRFDAGRAGVNEAKAARRVVPGAPPARPLSAYTGRYQHPGYGTITITVAPDREALTPSFGTMDLTLVHRHYETFDLRWHERGDEQPAVFPLTFLANPDGDVTAFTVPFQPSVEPLRFDRLPEPPDTEVLKRLCGSYTMGPAEIVIALRDDSMLTFTPPGPKALPVDLAPVRDLRFGVQGRPALSIEFELGADGAVTRLVLQPAGVFRPKEAS